MSTCWIILIMFLSEIVIKLIKLLFFIIFPDHLWNIAFTCRKSYSCTICVIPFVLNIIIWIKLFSTIVRDMSCFRKVCFMLVFIEEKKNIDLYKHWCIKYKCQKLFAFISNESFFHLVWYFILNFKSCRFNSSHLKKIVNLFHIFDAHFYL